MSCQSSECTKVDSAPRTPDPLDISPLCTLSPPKLHRTREDEDGQDYISTTQKNEIARRPPFPESIVYPSSSLMSIASIPQGESTSARYNLNRSTSNICSKRRSCSFDETIPIPRISLKPRFINQHHERSDSCPCANCSLTRVSQINSSRKRAQHFRSHTYDGSGSDLFPALFGRVSSPTNVPPFTMSNLNHALPHASKFSPLGSCSMDSPQTIPGVARPIPRHFTPAEAPYNLTSTPLSSVTATHGTGTICSSSASAFETAPSTIAKSRRTPSPQSDGETGQSPEDFWDSSLSNELLYSNKNLASTSKIGARFPEEKFSFPPERKKGKVCCNLPVDEVCVTGDSVVKACQTTNNDALKSPRNAHKDPFLGKISYSCESDESSLSETISLLAQSPLSRSILPPRSCIRKLPKSP